MANQEQLEILEHGMDYWNEWAKNRRSGIDLYNACLSGKNLRGFNLRRANLRHADLSQCKLEMADLSGADLSNASMVKSRLNKSNLAHATALDVSLFNADLSDADLSEVDLTGTDLFQANLSGCDLTNSSLYAVNFNCTNLNNANFKGAMLNAAIFGNVDLSKTLNLEEVRFMGPSTIGMDTLYRSKGKIPETFLRGCGVPEDLITYIPSLIGSQHTIIYNSCFISYSTKDEHFAKRLHSRMRDAKLRVWFAPEEMKGGRDLFEQIDAAIQVHDKLLLVLSESSMKSNWVEREIKRAFKTGEREKRKKLFPIRLVNYEELLEWEVIDGDTGKDVAAEIRKIYIPDFSNWKDHDSFETEFKKLLRDLQAEK